MLQFKHWWLIMTSLHCGATCSVLTRSIEMVNILKAYHHMLLCNICRLSASSWYLPARCQGVELIAIVSTAAFRWPANEPDVLAISLDVMDEVESLVCHWLFLASGICFDGTDHLFLDVLTGKSSSPAKVGMLIILIYICCVKLDTFWKMPMLR